MSVAIARKITKCNVPRRFRWRNTDTPIIEIPWSEHFAKGRSYTTLDSLMDTYGPEYKDKIMPGRYSDRGQEYTFLDFKYDIGKGGWREIL